ncbi:antirestriction protein ArdA [uncultured Oscillibacter sp.]|uniref:antirestriction protein ArdA n=1 Tax=uncultured Oscillibacter sp. TaxID=876091 RepID=UPI00262BC470|nr:antirestriction protein ArdA [uncultured Oscillibacter sp.]
MLTLYISTSGMSSRRLDLPMPLDKIKQQMEIVHTKEQSNHPVLIYGTESQIPILRYHLQSVKLDNDATLQKLNQLAETIDGMSAAGHYHLSRSLNPEFQQSLDDVLRIAAHIKPGSLDCYEVIPGVTSDQELGKWLVEHDHLEDKVPEALRPYLDYRSIGIDYRNEHEGVFLADGYTGIRTGAMEQVLEEQGVMRLTLAMSKNTFSLSLPAGEDRLEQAKRALEIEDFSQASITAVKFSSPYLDGLLPLDTITVEDANTLALCLREMEQEDGELIKFCAVLEVEQPDTFTEAVTIAMDRDDYERVPEDMDEYGKQVLRRAGADDEVIDTIDGYMAFARLGSDSLAEDGVRRTEFGLVRRVSKPFPPGPEIGQAMM